MVAREDRFRHDHPCPICGGYDEARRGQGERCWGFLSPNGTVAFCTNDACGGALAKEAKNDAYRHRLVGDCRCGVRHDPSPPSSGPRRGKGRIVATYDYRDEQGTLLSQAVRYTPKGFSQRRPDGQGGWIADLKGVRRVPYRLPEVRDAVQSGRPIYVVEGEEDVKALVDLGLDATCNSEGAGKWRDDFAEVLRGATVVVLRDYDVAGRRHRDQVLRSLFGKAASIKAVELPGMTEVPTHGADIRDWLKAGHTKAELLALVEAAPVLTAADTGEAKSDAASQDDTPTVEALLAQLQDTPDVHLVFKAIATLAQLPTEEWSPLKGRLKQLLGADLNLNDLEKARKEARPRAEPGGDAARAGASVLAEEIAGEWRGRVLFDRTRRRWLAYRAREGEEHWWELSEEQMLRKIGQALTERLPDGYNWSFLQGMERLLRVELEGQLPTPPRELLPLRNGVLHLRTRQLGPHAPEHGFAWCLPFDYTPGATCPAINKWLLEAQDGDEARVGVLLAYARAVVTGRVTLQRFLELVGPGGTGKGTYERLLMALVGLANVHVTDLRQLETNRFETSNILGKRLVVITDADRYGGPVQVLKALTGGDDLRNERKYDPDAPHFTPEAMVIVAANEAVQSTDYTSGLERRRLSIPFQHQPQQVRQLIEFDRGQAVGEFTPELPGLLNAVLAIDEAEMVRLLRQTDVAVSSLREAWRQSLVETNSLAAWADATLQLDPDATSPIGVAEREPKTGHYVRADEWLYASYRQYAERAGEGRPISLRRFRRLLEDFCRHQLKVTTVESGRNDTGACLTGVRLRRALEPLASGFIQQALDLAGQGAKPSSNTPTRATNGTDGCLTDQTLAPDGTDGFDGFSKKSIEDPPTLHPVETDKGGGGVYRKGYEQNPSNPSNPSGARVSSDLHPSDPSGRGVEPCPMCGGRRFWLNDGWRPVCWQCKPPLSMALVRAWLELPAAEAQASRNGHPPPRRS
jgi:P4 family phage/plasmid primase-like protien